MSNKIETTDSVCLYDKQNLHIFARLHDGKLYIEGQDLGSMASTMTGGDSDYEYFYEFNEKNTQKLQKLLDVEDRIQGLLSVIKEHFGGQDGCAQLCTLCSENGIEYSFFSY